MISYGAFGEKHKLLRDDLEKKLDFLASLNCNGRKLPTWSPTLHICFFFFWRNTILL